MTVISFHGQAPRGLIPQFSASWGPGLHVVVQSVDGSPSALFDVLAGSTPARGCTVTLGDGLPWAAMAYIPETLVWPGDLHVDEALAVAAASRGAPRSSVNALARFGLGSLHNARVRELEPATLRAIALLEAVDNAAVRVLLVGDGPLDGRVAPSLLSLLRARAAAGAAVLVAARECGTVEGATSEMVLRAEGSSRIRIDTDDPATLTQALAGHAPLHVEQSGKGTLWITGTSTTEALAAVNQALAGTPVAIRRLEVAS